MTQIDPEDERLDPDVPQVGPEFETMAEATEATQWPLMPVLTFARPGDDFQMEWRRAVTSLGRRPMGEAELAHMRYSEARCGDLYLYAAADEREGWFAIGPVDVVPPGIGTER